MARFTVRVQLRDVEEGDSAYETLHEEMGKKGFSRTISSDDTTYHLPTGSYNYVGERSIDDVLSRAKSAADKTGNESRIIVTEGTRKWSGLETE